MYVDFVRREFSLRSNAWLLKVVNTVDLVSCDCKAGLIEILDRSVSTEIRKWLWLLQRRLTG